ncbi:uncharacterized protein JCM10292_000812 [Rhodotorula paludigena]|uniref:uncharacterized protein n=1 Tax=Rhodotorula paludigena TaxID=86838 RepID=UPI00317E28DD
MGVFAPETPSRVLRRIHALNEQSLPDLPDLPAELPSFSETEADSTLAYSPVKTRPLSPPARDEPENVPPPHAHQQSPPTPYTSTPAPSTLYAHSQSTIGPPTARSTLSQGGYDSNATVTAGPKSRFLSRPAARSPTAPRRAAGELQTTDEETDEGPSGVSAISRRGDDLDNSRDGMVVLSGGSGAEDELDAHPGTSRGVEQTLELASLPPAQVETEDDEEEETSRRDETETDGERNAERRGAHPLDALGPLDDEGDLQEAPPTVKKPSPSPRESSFDNILPETLSPLRERDATETTVASPELGRNSSPRTSPHQSLSDFRHDATPSRAFGKSPSPALSHATPRLDSPLASLNLNVDPSTPFVNQLAAQRRASHLLTTLRSTAKPRFARGTPHPARSAQKPSIASPAAAEDGAEHTSTSFASDRSSNDLTTFHKANTSLPVSGGSGAEAGLTAPGSRFNGAKLNAYLHTLNTHLTEENQSLVKTLQRTSRDVERLEGETRRLEDTIREMSVVAGAGGIGIARSSRTDSIAEEDESAAAAERSSRLDELDGLVRGQRRIRGMQDELGIGGSDDGDAADRIRKLEAALERANAQAAEKDHEIRRLRERVVSGASPGDADDTEQSTLVSGLQREVFELKDALDEADAEREALRADLAKLQRDFAAAGEASSSDFGALQRRTDELLVELEERDVELEGARKQMEEQEAEFADKMAELEQELCRVMEEQERKVERARDEVEAKRREDDDARREERERLRRVEEERDELERKLVEGASDSAAADLEEKVHALRGDVARLEDTVKTLRGDVAARDDELARMQEELEAAERHVAELEQRDGPGGADNDLRQQLAQKDEELKQLEDALDDSAQQLVDNETVLAEKEEELASLRAQLDAEQQKSSGLETRLTGLNVPKAKSPLANEVYSASQEETISSLEEELDAARKEADDLRRQLAAATSADKAAEVRDLEVRQLEANKADLEDRVKSLRQQVSMQYSPSKTPDKSWALRPLPSVYTPKTPGQLFGNLSTWSPGSAANETISPLLAQIHELEQIVEQLQSQLADANVQIDSKLDRLEAAGSGTISLARQLSLAQSRIAQLEDELERLLGAGGSLERVQARLAKVHCPDCRVTFDANKSVRLRVDRTGITFADASSAASPKTESLKTTLANVNAKLAELRVENGVLQDQASRSKELAAEKAKAVKQHEAVQRDLKHARDEIAVLEIDLRTERSRLRNLANEQTLAGKAKAALEARLATAEVELRAVKKELAQAVAADVVERLRKEKEQLVSERADLLRQLADVNERASRVDSDLTTTRTDQVAMKSQLDRQVAEIQSLRDSLHTKEAEQRMLQDERGDILRGVAGLQADLNRVRQDAISLGLDLAAVRRERDELGAKNKGEDAQLVSVREELSLAKRKLAAMEQQALKHVCSSTNPPSSASNELQAQHKSEMKGLLVLIRQLKLRVEREMEFRAQAGVQKRYLENVVQDKQETIDSIMTQLNLPVLSAPSRKKPASLRSVAFSVIAVARMRRLAQAWKEQSAPKKRLREQAYPSVRGRPFPA